MIDNSNKDSNNSNTNKASNEVLSLLLFLYSIKVEFALSKSNFAKNSSLLDIMDKNLSMDLDSFITHASIKKLNLDKSQLIDVTNQ